MLSCHNHHDVYKKFPPMSFVGGSTGNVPNVTTPALVTFGSATAYTAGSGSVGAPYSWLVRLLPYIEETVLYNNISQKSNKFVTPAFTTGTNGLVDANGRPFATIEVGAFKCPSFAGEPYSVDGTVVTVARPTVYANSTFTNSGVPFGVALTNYTALSATHIGCMAQSISGTAVEAPNGVIVPGTGKNFRDMVDGSSKTVVLAETKEQTLASWYDGTQNFVVAAGPPSSAPSPRTTTQPTKNSNGFWVAADPATCETALNLGPRPNTAARYLPSGWGANSNIRLWGPSADHSGGVIIHGIGDGAVKGLTEDIDATLYFQLVTRAGREPQSIPE